MLLILISIAVGFIFAFALLYALFRRNSKLPPGPFRIPVFGNALEMPTEYTWVKLSQWAVKYGDIMYLEALGQPMVVLSSTEMANDLLSKRSAFYSDRPDLNMARLSGYGKALPLCRYGDAWRVQRRLIAQEFAPSAAPKFQKIQELQARKLMQMVLNSPDQLENEVKLCIGSIIVRAAYGYWLSSSEDPFLKIPLQAMENFSQAVIPGAWLVDVIPMLKYLPVSLPGAGFLRTAKEWAKIPLEATERTYSWSKQELLKGTALEPNFCASIINQHNGVLEESVEDSLKWGASSAMGGGMDTNMSTIMSFFMLMIIYPEVQKTAQKELETVVGSDRLPNLFDRPDLPYIRGLVTEIYRLCPAFPLGIPHQLIQDDYYNGMFLSKGTVVLPNVWHMMRDANHFVNPELFDPNRYHGSDAEMNKVTDAVFGFGRRRCPGFEFAQQTVFYIVATALATCNVLPAVSSEGDLIIPEPNYTSGTIIFPKKFGYRLEERSEQSTDLLKQSIEERDFY